MTALRIALHGFNDRVQSGLKLYLTRHLTPTWVTPGETADLHLINLDHRDGHRFWRNNRSSSGLPSIVLSMEQQELPGSLWLKMPLDLQSLLNSIQSLTAQKTLPSPPLSASPRAASSTTGQLHYLQPDLQPAEFKRYYPGPDDSVYTDPAQQQAWFYTPAQHLHSSLFAASKQAQQHNQPQQVQVAGITLWVTADGDFVYSDVRDALLNKLGFIQADSPQTFSIQHCQADQLPTFSSDWRWRHLADLVWRQAIWSARGRVPLNTTLHQPVSLRRWPNLTRMQRMPHASQVMALWYGKPTSLIATVQLLDLPYRVVFALYSACKALDLVEDSPNLSLHTAVTKEAPNALPRRLFKALLGRLQRM